MTSQSISVTCTKKAEHIFVYASFYTNLKAPQIFFKLSYSIFKILLKASTETLQSFQANHTVKTKRAPFLVKRRRSSHHRTKQSANKKTAESNRRNYPVRIEHQSVHVKSGFVRRLVAQS